MEVCGYEFETVSRLDPERTDAGVVVTGHPASSRGYLGDAAETPRREYESSEERPVHAEGWGPFCRFEVSSPRASKPGVYLVTVDDEAVYVGEAANVAERFSDAYGDISPADCFEGEAGRPDVCRVNTNVFHAARAGKDVHVHLHSTADFEGSDGENAALRRIIRGDLLSEFDAAWNREDGDEAVADARTGREETPGGAGTGSPEPGDERAGDAGRRADAEGAVRRGSPPDGKYAPLYEYLAGHEFDRVQLSFSELEVVLGAPVPDSARNWRQWWTNSEESHPHARSWLRAGYEVASLSLPDELVVFERRLREGGAGRRRARGGD